MDGREGTDGIGNSEEVDGGESDSGGVDGGESDSGGVDGGESDSGGVDGGESDSGGVDGGESDSGGVDGGESDSGGVDGGESDSGGVDGGERGCECDSNLDDGEQLLHHEDTVDIRFTLLQWVCILFVRLQLRFGLTNAAATAILAFVSLLLGLITHPLHSIFPKNLPAIRRIASLDNFTKKKSLHCMS